MAESDVLPPAAPVASHDVPEPTPVPVKRGRGRPPKLSQQSGMPPKKSTKTSTTSKNTGKTLSPAKKATPCQCPICEEQIVDATKLKPGQESIFVMIRVNHGYIDDVLGSQRKLFRQSLCQISSIVQCVD